MRTEARRVNAEYDPVYMAAAEWLLKLQDPRRSLEETLAWQEWMSSNARYEEASSRLQNVSAAVFLTRPPAIGASRRLTLRNR